MTVLLSLEDSILVSFTCSGSYSHSAPSWTLFPEHLGTSVVDVSTGTGLHNLNFDCLCFSIMLQKAVSLMMNKTTFICRYKDKCL